MNGPHWIKQWIADLALLNDQFRNEDGSVDFSALGREEYQFRMALITRKFSNSERAKDIFEKAKAAYEVNVERGKKGGRPRKDSVEDGARESQRRAGADSVRGTPLHSAPARSPARKFRNKEEFIQWAIDTGLDPDDAGNCWEATMERGGLTKDGKKVENICAYAVKWCRTSKKNRETA